MASKKIVVFFPAASKNYQPQHGFSTRENFAQAPSRREPKMVERAVGRWLSQVRKVLDVITYFFHLMEPKITNEK